MFVALSIQYEMRMRHIVICGLSRSTIFCPHYLINNRIFEEKKLLNAKCGFWFSLQLLSEIFLILRRTERDMIKSIYWSTCKVPLLFLSDFSETWISFNKFSKNTEIQNFMKIRPVGAELFHADGRTNRHDEAQSRFSQFCERAQQTLGSGKNSCRLL